MQLVLILTLMIFVSTGACPNMCRCKNYPRDKPAKTSLYFTSVSCDVYSENITMFLDNTTRDFQVSNLSEEELANILNNLGENKNDLPYLINIDITLSDVGNLTADIFEKIISLAISNNGLEALPKLVNLSTLQKLDLSRNELTEIEANTFELLRTLELLNLSGNALINLTTDSFSGLSALKCLDLSRNKLNKVEDQVLQPLTALQYLNLSSNRLESLNEVSFSSLIMLQQLDVSWNRLARVAPGSLQLPSLARLLLAGNPQLGRSREANVLVGTGRKLQVVDASRTGLKQVPAALTHSIRTLRLAGNSIRSVNCGDLDSYPLLQLLDFTSNEIESVEEDALGRLESLTVLYFTANKIKEIPKSLPEKLSVLHLERNEIEKITEKDLVGLDALEVLLLNDNKIRVIGEAAFGQLTSLVTLDLSQNPLHELQPGCLTGPTALQVLRMASIGIILPAEEVSFPLSTPEHLITLDLSDSPGLARQLLADTAALAAARELQELDLSRTDLEYVRSDLLHYLPQLRVLHIRDNRLNCSQLQWLASWIRRQDEPEYRDVVCASPADLWGTPLVDLQDVEVSFRQPINQQGVESRTAINLTAVNITNMLQISENNTRQYKLENISRTMIQEKGENNTISNIQSLYLNEAFVKVRNLKKGKYDYKNMNDTIKKTLNNKNEVLITEGDIIAQNASLEHLTTVSSVNNDRSFGSWRIIPTHANVTLSTDRGSTINQAGKVAITETATTLKQTVAGASERQSSAASTSESENANETVKSRSNKPDQRSFISESSRNLFIAREGRAFNNKNGTHDRYTKESEEPIDHTETSSQGEMSMFTINKNDNNGFLLHPGMIILAAGIMGAAAALAMLAARFTKRRRNAGMFRQEDIEVTSLPSVTELW